MRIVSLIIGIALGATLWAPSARAIGVVPGCTRLLQNYDRAVLFFYNSGNHASFALEPAIAKTAQRARGAGCVSGDLDVLLFNRITDDEINGASTGPVIVESGAPIRPTSLQVGIVGGIVSEVQARSFFSGLGLRVRSQGAPGLGRRIYLGPFRTEGGLAAAVALAERAGFIAPYPRRF